MGIFPSHISYQLKLRAGGWLCVWLMLIASVAAQSTDTVPKTGLGVLGKTLGLHGFLLVRGDVVLKTAQIVGNGELVIQDSVPRQLISHASSLNKLKIDNPKGVFLDGELTIHRQLLIRRGVVNAQLAKLRLSNSCRLVIDQEGCLRQEPTVMDDRSPRPLKIYTFHLDGWFTYTILENRMKIPLSTSENLWCLDLCGLTALSRQPNHPPPKLTYMG